MMREHFLMDNRWDCCWVYEHFNFQSIWKTEGITVDTEVLITDKAAFEDILSKTR